MTTLHRIEATNVDGELTEGLAARSADPLWYLARQWQVGEFRGEDAASPVLIEAEIDCYPVTDTFVETRKGREVTTFDMAARPLQAQIEQETEQASRTTRDLVQSSLRLIGMFFDAGLDPDFIAKFKTTFRFGRARLRDDEDPVGAARLAVLAEGGFNPGRLLKEIDAVGDTASLDVLSALDPDSLDAATDAIDAWLAEDGKLSHNRAADAATAWLDKRQEYRFGVSAKVSDNGTIELKAPGYTGGRLDWHHFDLHRVPKEFPKANRASLRMLASPLKFAGQPAQRFWEIEEGGVYFGDLAGGAADLSRSILGAYAAVAGDDWFVLPATLPAGHIARVARVTVRDNFDGPTEVRSIAVEDAAQEEDRVWRWFEHRNRTGVAHAATPLLFMPPAMVDPLRGPVQEEVHFRRDEMANLAWAIERRHQGRAGRTIVAERPQVTQPPEPEVTGDWTFELGHAVPAHWFPLVPIRTTTSSPEVLLRRGLVSHASAGPSPRAKGVLLTPWQPFLLEEATVPTYGTEVTRRWHLARSADGGRHLWMARRKRPSNGAMEQSPLLYDELAGWPETRRGL